MITEISLQQRTHGHGQWGGGTGQERSTGKNGGQLKLKNNNKQANKGQFLFMDSVFKALCVLSSP